MTNPLLAPEFPEATREQWLKRVEAVLKGESFAEKLVSETADGIRVEPLYGEMPGQRAERSEHRPWIVQARADHPDAERANTQALDDLVNGAAGLTLVGKGHELARGFGITPEDLPRVLDGIPLHAISLRLEASDNTAKAFAAHIERQPIDPARLEASFGLHDNSLVKALEAQGFRGPFLEADGRALHEQGATEAQELGAVLAKTASFLDVAPPSAIGVTLAAGQDMFVTLASSAPCDFSGRGCWSPASFPPRRCVFTVKRAFA